MNDDLRKLIALGLAAAALLTAVLLVAPKLLGLAAGPETEILTVLKEAEAAGLELAVPGSAEKLVAKRAGYQRISVVVTNEQAVVTATLDFDGQFGSTEVSSLGAERIPFELGAQGWGPKQGFAPRLTGVVRALEKRRAALERGDVTGLCSGRADAGETSDLEALLAVNRRRLRATRWLMRNERDDVLVTEEWRLGGDLPDRPVDDRGTRRLLLQPAAAGEFCFPDGLM